MTTKQSDLVSRVENWGASGDDPLRLCRIIRDQAGEIAHLRRDLIDFYAIREHYQKQQPAPEGGEEARGEQNKLG